MTAALVTLRDPDGRRKPGDEGVAAATSLLDAFRPSNLWPSRPGVRTETPAVTTLAVRFNQCERIQGLEHAALQSATTTLV